MRVIGWWTDPSQVSQGFVIVSCVKIVSTQIKSTGEHMKSCVDLVAGKLRLIPRLIFQHYCACMPFTRRGRSVWYNIRKLIAPRRLEMDTGCRDGNGFCAIRRLKLDFINLRTDQPYAAELGRFFETREKRRLRG